MKIFFVRHGKTEENEKGIIMGHLPGTLSSLGLKQANTKAKMLKDREIDFICSSDLKRALDTGNIIARSLHMPLKSTKALRECQLGKLQGSIIDPNLEYKFDTDYCKNKFKKYSVEHPSDFYKRLKTFLSFLYNNYSDKTILIVSHSIAFRFFVAAAKNKPASYASRIRSLENDEIAVFYVNKKVAFNSRLSKKQSYLHRSIFP